MGLFPQLCRCLALKNVETCARGLTIISLPLKKNVLLALRKECFVQHKFIASKNGDNGKACIFVDLPIRVCILEKRSIYWFNFCAAALLFKIRPSTQYLGFILSAR